MSSILVALLAISFTMSLYRALTPQDEWNPATRPTMYFVGVSTHQSSIMRIFPRWTEYLETDVQLQGVNFKLHDHPESYRRLVEFIKHDPLSVGALVTTHKLDLFSASFDLFDGFDEFARVTNEVSAISKSDGKLIGHATDPITCGLAMEAFLPVDYWQKSGAEALVLGAGGSSVAVTWQLLQKTRGKNRPAKIVVTNRSKPRLESLEALHHRMHVEIPVEYHLTPKPELSDQILGKMKPGSLIMNATGLGKDSPGSPLTFQGIWPEKGIAWDFNYRGDLIFLNQAKAQQQAKQLRIEDGWIYFLHGWMSVMSEVLHRDIPSTGPIFERLAKIAQEFRKPEDKDNV